MNKLTIYIYIYTYTIKKKLYINYQLFEPSILQGPKAGALDTVPPEPSRQPSRQPGASGEAPWLWFLYA